jgi:hypothetical protein
MRNQMTTRARHLRRHDDEGVALVVAIATIGLVAAMTATMMVYVLRENRQSGTNRHARWRSPRPKGPSTRRSRICRTARRRDALRPDDGDEQRQPA